MGSAKPRSKTPKGRAILACGIVAGLTLWIAFVSYTHRASAQMARVDVYDAFETRALSNIWETDKFVGGAVTMQSEVVRAGRGAARVVLHSRDKFEAGVNGEKDSERAELTEAEKLLSREDTVYEFSFSMLIPADFPLVPTRLVIAQWKQDCHGHAACSNDSPVVAVRYVSGVLQITQQTSRHRTVLFATGEDRRGKWTDFRFQIRFSAHENGLLRAWLNGKPVVDYRGVNAYPENAATGYANPSRFYFKMGLYRDLMAEPMTIYIDEYRKRQFPGGL